MANRSTSIIIRTCHITLFIATTVPYFYSANLATVICRFDNKAVFITSKEFISRTRTSFFVISTVTNSFPSLINPIIPILDLQNDFYIWSFSFISNRPSTLV